MAGLVKPKLFPVRDPKSDAQDAGMIYNPKRFSHHGGLDSAGKWPKDSTGFRDIEPPTKIRTAEESRRGTDD